ncbi:hypothetical protein [Streptomyces collinus]|uniref:hypothetical protein n=1 Tax=Streptomyces collinus TaxID=42684 RepID=UPI00342512AF
MTNLLSSLTGLFFGVPFALMVLTRLSGAQTELLEQRAVRRLAERVTADFNADLAEFSQKAPLRDDSSSLKELVREWKESLAAAEIICRRALMPPDAGQPRVQSTMEDAATALNAVISLRPFAEVNYRDLEPILRVLKARWAELDREVRVRAAEVGLGWVPYSFRAAVSGALKEELFLYVTTDTSPLNNADILGQVNAFLDNESGDRKAAADLWAAVTASDEIRRSIGVPPRGNHP